ncbi:MAG TPA: polysaccharide biosynthesis C-terminal domain-containing protein [Gammaproteobacteria bacterium]
MESIFKPAFILMSGRALGFVASFAIPVILARVFDQSEFGTYKQLFLIYSTLYCIAQLGMAEGLFYFLPSAQQLGGRYAHNAMLVLAGAGAACLAFLWLARSSISGWLSNGQLAEYLPLIGVYLLAMLISAVLEIVMTARKHHLSASVVYAGSDLLRTSLMLLPVLWSGRLDWLLYGAIIFSLLRLGVTLIYLAREFGGVAAPNMQLARTQLAYAAPFSIYVLIEVLQINLHMYAVSYYFDAATFAIYAVGCLSIPLVDFLMSSACNVMMVRMREYLLAGVGGAVLAIWRDTTRKLMLLFAPLVGCLLVVAHELIVVLFTDNYVGSVPVFMVWVLTIFFVTFLTDGVLRVYAQIKFLMLLGFLKLAILAAVIPWFLQEFGLLGAVLATLLTTVAAKALALRRIKSEMNCKLKDLLPWRNLTEITGAAAVSALLTLAVKSALTLGELPVLLVTPLIYLTFYMALLWSYNLLNIEEKLTLTQWLLRLVRLGEKLKA